MLVTPLSTDSSLNGRLAAELAAPVQRQYQHQCRGTGIRNTWYSTSLWHNLVKGALRYGTRCRSVTQLHLTPTRLSTNGMILTCFCVSSQSWSLWTDPGGMEGWVGLGTTAVSKESSVRPYVTNIAVVSCSSRYARLTGQVGVSGQLTVATRKSGAKRPTRDLYSRQPHRCVT